MNLESLVNDVLSDVKRKFRQTHPAREESFTDVVRGFIAAVDWKVRHSAMLPICCDITGLLV